MKPESYLAWKEKPTDVIAPEWRAPVGETPRRRGIRAFFGFGRRPRSNWIRDF